jgi:phosphoribosylamine--glycine ligase
VGRGGRESALAWRLRASPSVRELVVVDDQPGWPPGVRRIHAARGIAAAAVEEGVDLVVVGPEGPLAEGLVDALGAVGVPAFGPTAAAARLESSKSFAKEVLRAAGVATADALVVRMSEPAEVAAGRARCARGGVVLKADGLAAGKGVVVAPGADEALAAFEDMRRFGGAADVVLLEELLDGPEVSVFGLSDGVRVVPLPSAQDHKRLGEGDTGPNTGGMGAIAPCPLLDDAAVAEIVRTVHEPVVREMARRGTPFRGVLYAGLMMTASGPRVLEFNARFGDPECQVLMALWRDDPVPWLLGCAVGRVPEGRPRFGPGAAAVVVLAAAGYPGAVTRGAVIPEPELPAGTVLHAGTRRDAAGRLVADGGRVLGVVGTGDTVGAAVRDALAVVPQVAFEGAIWRRDIGARWS